MIERLVRIVEVVANSENGGVASFRMIIDLVPHYLQLAIPAALFLAMIISIDRLSRSGELVTMLSAGLSLRHLSRPFFLLAALTAIASIIVTGFLQPLGRYDYRQTVNSIETQSFKAAFQEGRFVEVNDFTVWTDYRDFAGRELGETFIIQKRPDGSERYISAPSGELLETGPDTFALSLDRGRGATIATARLPGETDPQRLEFESLVWPIEQRTATFRDRGTDERELMLFELIDASTFPPVSQSAATASMHDQLSRAVLVLILPLLAFPLGLNLGRKPKTGGIVTGIVVLLIVQKALEYGNETASNGTIPGWAGSWPIVAATALLGAFMFSRTAGESILNMSPSRTKRNDDLALSSDGQTA